MKRLIFILLLLPAVLGARTYHDDTLALPGRGVKTNLLWDAAATVNLGVELRTGGHTSLDIPLNYNAWSLSESRKWKHWAVQPELRWWTGETFRGHFFGLHAHYARYNVGGLPDPFSDYMKAHRFEGWLAGAGLSYGYRWNFNRRLALEATLGAGYAYLSYDRFDCGPCGERIDGVNRHYVGPTRAGISLIFGIGGKRAARPQPVPANNPVPINVHVHNPAPAPREPLLRASYVTPEVEAVKVRSESGNAYLDFVVGRWEIRADFRNNAFELRKIYASIESVRNDPAARLTGITITGHASPEGSAASNFTLSHRRAQALKDHLRSVYGIREELFNARGAGEDWATLALLVDRSELPEKHLLRAIIRGADDHDSRDARLKALFGGHSYRQMHARHFPLLRRVDYRIGYTVTPFTIEQGRQVMRTHPGRLSLNEMYLIANTHTPGSREFNEVFETAARVFPESDVANVNAAASALERREVASAARYLARVKQPTPVYWNNMGVLAWLQGDRAKAAECFAKGGIQCKGNADALDSFLHAVNR